MQVLEFEWTRKTPFFKHENIINQYFLSKIDNCYFSHDDYCLYICFFACHILTTHTPMEVAFHNLSQGMTGLVPCALEYSKEKMHRIFSCSARIEQNKKTCDKYTECIALSSIPPQCCYGYPSVSDF